MKFALVIASAILVFLNTSFSQGKEGITSIDNCHYCTLCRSDSSRLKTIFKYGYGVFSSIDSTIYKNKKFGCLFDDLKKRYTLIYLDLDYAGDNVVYDSVKINSLTAFFKLNDTLAMILEACIDERLKKYFPEKDSALKYFCEQKEYYAEFYTIYPILFYNSWGGIKSMPTYLKGEVNAIKGNFPNLSDKFKKFKADK